MRRRQKERRCLSCAYRSADSNGWTEGCGFIQITGHSRLKEAYQRLGVNTVTEEVHEAMRPENCTHYQKGTPKRTADRDIVLPGSRPKNKQTMPTVWPETPKIGETR